MPGWLRCVQVEPMDTAKLSVTRFEYSVETSSWRAGGSSPVLDHATVGSDSSSATHGSSMPSVAGKKRPPTKQCASAPAFDRTTATVANAAVRTTDLSMGKLRLNEINRRRRLHPASAAHSAVRRR